MHNWIQSPLPDGTQGAPGCQNLKNAWYVACMPAEIDEKPLGHGVRRAHRVLPRPDGKAGGPGGLVPAPRRAAVAGPVVEGKLVCGYHGLEMGCDGKTVAMPASACADFTAAGVSGDRAFGFVWVAGRCGKADPAAAATSPGPRIRPGPFGGGMFHVKCDYRLMIDNLMDLTHEKYVHATSIGQQELDEVPAPTSSEGDVVITRREMSGEGAAVLAGRDARQRPRTRSRWWTLAALPFRAAVERADRRRRRAGRAGRPTRRRRSRPRASWSTSSRPRPRPRSGTSGPGAQLPAPDYKACPPPRSARPRARCSAKTWRCSSRQQRNLSAQPERKLLSLNTDLGGVQARRMLERLVAQERGEAGVSGGLLSVRVARKSIEAEDICSPSSNS